jgi:hypothetical protein
LSGEAEARGDVEVKHQGLVCVTSIASGRNSAPDATGLFAE